MKIKIKNLNNLSKSEWLDLNRFNVGDFTHKVNIITNYDDEFTISEYISDFKIDKIDKKEDLLNLYFFYKLYKKQTEKRKQKIRFLINQKNFDFFSILSFDFSELEIILNKDIRKRDIASEAFSDEDRLHCSGYFKFEDVWIFTPLRYLRN